MSATAVLTEFSSSITIDSIPEGAVEIAKFCLLDIIACGIAGANSQAATILKHESLREGGRAEASVLNDSRRFSRLQAARINAAASHVLDFDDSAEAACSHLSSPIGHAVLALGQTTESSGEELVVAFVSGYEFACRLAQICGIADAYARGWHATPIVGCIGAAVACARLLGLSDEVTRHAVGIAATQAFGLKSMFGTMCKSFHAGEAASRGMRSAILASMGLTSCTNVIEADQGLASVLGGLKTGKNIDEYDCNTWFIYKNLFKYHAACHLTHPFIEAALEIRHEHHLVPDQIDSIKLSANHWCLKVCNIVEPQSGLESKFSLRHAVAQVLAGFDTGDIRSYSDANASHCALVELRQRVDIETCAERDRLSGRVEIVDKEGRRYTAEIKLGPEAGFVVTPVRLKRKFDLLVVPILGSVRSEALKQAVLDVTNLENVGKILSMAESPTH